MAHVLLCLVFLSGDLIRGHFPVTISTFISIMFVVSIIFHHVSTSYLSHLVFFPVGLLRYLPILFYYCKSCCSELLCKWNFSLVWISLKDSFLVAFEYRIIAFLWGPASSGSWGWPGANQPSASLDTFMEGWAAAKWQQKATFSREPLTLVESDKLQRILTRWEALSVLECFTSQGIKGAWWVQDLKNSQAREARWGCSGNSCWGCSRFSLPVHHTWFLGKRMKGDRRSLRISCSGLFTSFLLTANTIRAHAQVLLFTLENKSVLNRIVISS